MHKKSARIHHLLHSADLIERRLANLLAPLGIRPRQARVLNILDRVGAATQSTLASEMGVTAGSMSTMVKRLCATGLIQRNVDEKDLRSDVLSITTSGKLALGEVRKIWLQMDDDVVGLVGKEKAELVFGILQELKLGLGGRVPGLGWEKRPVNNPHDKREIDDD